MSTVAVTQALARSVAERGKALAVVDEDQWFDRKSSRVNARSLAELFVAFANAEGGIAVVGIWNGKVEGTDLRSAGQQNEWRQVGVDQIVPPLAPRAKRYECVTDSGRRDHLLVFEVQASEQVHATVRDEVFLRVGDEVRRLSFAQRQELQYDKGQANFERTPVHDLDYGGLNEELLWAYASAVDHPDPQRLLVARGLRTQKGELTVGAALLFGNEPQAFLPEALVRVVQYRGTERGTGSRQQVIRDVRLEGPIPALLRNAHDLISELLPTRRALGSSGLFEPIGLIPRDAWLEGLVNAVIHRSYSMQGDHIRVELFDDRIEIESPGRFPGVVDLGDPRAVTRFARNPRIARVCSDLRFGQELGEGIRRMCEEMRLAGLADPEYRQTAGSVQLTLRSAPFDRTLDDRLPHHARTVMRVLREVDRASTGELVEAVGLSRPVVLRTLHALQDEGLVEWRGHSPKDPRACWLLHFE